MDRHPQARRLKKLKLFKVLLDKVIRVDSNGSDSVTLREPTSKAYSRRESLDGASRRTIYAGAQFNPLHPEHPG